MPDDTINIYVDATFSSPSDTAVDSDVELTLAEADVIGAYNMPVVYTTTASTSGTVSSPVEYFKVDYTISGTENIYIECFTTSTTESGIFVCLVDYAPGETVSGTKNTYVDFFGASTTTSGYQYALVNYIAGQVLGSYLDINVPLSYWTAISVSGTEDLDIEYRRASASDGAITKITETSFGSYATMTSGSVDSNVDLTLAGWANFPLIADLFCSLEDIEGIQSELITISGGLYGCYTDILSCASGIADIDFDVFCCLVDYVAINHELTVISGAVNNIDCYVTSNVDDIKSFGCDIDLLSLKISNFIPAEDDYVYGSEGISVDVTDDVYNVLTSSGVSCSGTCLKVDGVAVETTFSGITDGYRMYYDPPTGFEFLGGSTEFLVRAENSNGDVLERSYYLTNGYFMDYVNYPGRFDFGWENQILVRMSAEDLATCPKFSADAYWFITEHLIPKDLSARIVGIPAPVTEAIENLQASISPQSTAFFYGKTFRVVLTCKDFEGNIMEPYEFEFKIEDGPD